MVSHTDANTETHASGETEFEFGLYTLGDLSADPGTGGAIDAQRRIKEVIEAAKLADEAGLDVFGVGEHHRLDFAITSPPVLLAAIGQATKRIRLTSATTVLGTADPVRVFEDFATLDLLSNGRAEIIAGRGAYVESFPLFGYELDDYKELFAEKLELLLQLGEHERITWNGELRSPLKDAQIAPRPMQPTMPVWVGVGGTPASAEMAGRLGVGMTLAILGGDPKRFRHLIEAYNQSHEQAGHPKRGRRVAITSHGFIAKTAEQALSDFYPHYASYFYEFMGGRERGEKLTKERFEQEAGAETALAVGCPQQVVEKILAQHELFGHNRFMVQFDIGGVPYAKLAGAIELLATEVMPAVKRELKRKNS